MAELPSQVAADHVFWLEGGRWLAVDERGRPDGRPVLFLHPAPGSRVLDPDPWATAGARVRLLSFDRPGYGGSSPLPEGMVPTLPHAADDAAEVLGRLGIDRTPVVGWSAGGLVALALAARHPHLVTSVVMVATPAHEDDVARMSDEHKAMVASLRPDLAAASAAVADALGAIADSPEAMLDLLGDGPADEAVRYDRSHRPRLWAMASEAIRQGVTGVAGDIVASTIAPWGFDPSDVEVPATLWYGEQDSLVTPEHGAYWAGVLMEGDLRIVPGAGHFLPLLAWREILASAT
ncbi:MAG: alpha/beta hydrolase [Actinomycetota bacterium]|nr:alpha/beta hydrolase [Actinomycetota bacterium]